jgi:sterol 3beta-glucosyltransferase
VALVIHHGGAGTTHSATRSGKPSVVVPFAGDQSFWADRLHRLGVAAAAVDGNAPTPSAFERAIDFALLSSTQARAQRLGEAMRQEDGVRTAVAAIERLAAAGQELRSVGICPVNAHA